MTDEELRLLRTYQHEPRTWSEPRLMTMIVNLRGHGFLEPAGNSGAWRITDAGLAALAAAPEEAYNRDTGDALKRAGLAVFKARTDGETFEACARRLMRAADRDDSGDAWRFDDADMPAIVAEAERLRGVERLALLDSQKVWP